MKSNWKEVYIDDIAKINKNSYSIKENWDFVNYLDTGNIVQNAISQIQNIDLKKEKLPSRAKRKVKKNSIIYSTVRPNQLHYGFIKNQPENFLVSTGFSVIDVNDEIACPKFIYYFLTQNNITQYLQNIAEQSVSTYPSIKPSDIQELKINLPLLEEQQKIAYILSALDEKIEVNQKINENLEHQAQVIFKNMFGDDIDNLDNTSTTLSDFIENVDNRGKTPPLSKTKTEYPIIDVKALSGNSRIIDYNNCTKYVDENTYKTWFRSGHPKNYDILISTVGSLAEIKLFLGNKGCIAQNVVGFRCKNISSLYLYQYLKYIKNDLVTYNIGSVQPSIKVTHIIKHKIFVPKMEKLQLFDEIAQKFTKQIYNNHNEIENLKNIRDALLPKLMNGEIDVSDIKI